MMRPFQAGCGKSAKVSVRKARAPIVTALRVSNGLRVAEESSILTTSPISNSITDIDADAFAELEEARETSHAIMRRRDLDDGAAYARDRKSPQSLCNALFETFERRENAGVSVGHADAPRALIASCSDVSDCEVSAATPSKARVTSISRVISRTGSTFEFSTAP